MPRLPSAPLSDRIFARLDKFECACPECGGLVRANLTPRSHYEHRKKITRKRSMENAYNPVTSTLRCPHCLHTYQVGLILWPLRRSTRGWNIPSDQKPTAAQTRKLRQYAVGFAAEEAKRRGDSVNVFVTADCTCPMDQGGWTPSCPIHGWERVEELVNAQDEENKS